MLPHYYSLLCYFLINRLVLYNIFFYLFCFVFLFGVSPGFCVIFCVVSALACFFLIIVQVYRPLPAGENKIALNKYHNLAHY
jgi:hypothetical protein